MADLLPVLPGQHGGGVSQLLFIHRNDVLQCSLQDGGCLVTLIRHLHNAYMYKKCYKNVHVYLHVNFCTCIQNFMYMYMYNAHTCPRSENVHVYVKCTNVYTLCTQAQLLHNHCLLCLHLLSKLKVLGADLVVLHLLHYLYNTAIGRGCQQQSQHLHDGHHGRPVGGNISDDQTIITSSIQQGPVSAAR